MNQIVKTWVKTISRAKGLNEQLVQEANAKIFTYGSYRLGVWKYSYRPNLSRLRTHTHTHFYLCFALSLYLSLECLHVKGWGWENQDSIVVWLMASVDDIFFSMLYYT